MLTHLLGCRPADHPHLGRRELLRVGGMSLVGMGLNNGRPLDELFG